MFQIQTDPIDSESLRREMSHQAAGAFVSFEGRVRNHNDGREVRSLEYQCYASMAVREGMKILSEAVRRHGLLAARCVHREGHLHIGEIAVWVGVLSGHRGEGFAGCREIIDEVKIRIPIWKKEHYVGGDSEWVRCDACAAGHFHKGDKGERLNM